ncbi:MAG TPA: hypothetical protein PKW59_14740 [Thermotogota bacterium]|nr:hypothetical protein [Thermotogota bacterium]
MRPGFLPRYSTNEPEPEQTITIPDEIANAVLRIVEQADAAEATKQAEANRKHAEEKARQAEGERITAQLPGVFKATHPTPLDETLDKMISTHSRTEAAQKIAALETKTQKIAELEKKANNLNSRLSWIEDMK